MTDVDDPARGPDAVSGAQGDPDQDDTGPAGTARPGLMRRWWRGLDRALMRLHRRIQASARIIVIIYGVALGCVGLMDLYRGLDLGAKGDGFLLLVSSVVIAGGGGTARRSWLMPVWRRRAHIATDLGMFAVSAWIVFRIQSNFVVQLVLVIMATVILSATLLALILAYGDVRDRRQLSAGRVPSQTVPDEAQAKSTVTAGRVGAGGTLLAAVVALLPFWFTAHYTPSHDFPVVQVAGSIENVERHDDHAELTVDITIENKGNTPVTLLTSLYEITGTDITYSPKGKPLEDLPYGDITGRVYGSAARVNPYNHFPDPVQIQVGPAADDYAWFGPDEEVKTTLIVKAPLFPLYRITVDADVARADRVQVEDRPTSTRGFTACGDMEITEDRRPLIHKGLFDRLTESDREAVTYWVVKGPKEYGDISPWWAPYPWNGASIQHAGHGCDHPFRPSDKDGLEETAMVGRASSVGEAGLPPKP
ncbi:hypothetical protein ACH4UV_07245 [Streptomyces sp. NPDC020802]|uniref:hypothetical protein n=1 Tax=Streptomyces sp. NPDC020802 TaxID=3365094 RepID=UPI0037B0FEA2